MLYVYGNWYGVAETFENFRLLIDWDWQFLVSETCYSDNQEQNALKEPHYAKERMRGARGQPGPEPTPGAAMRCFYSAEQNS